MRVSSPSCSCAYNSRIKTIFAAQYYATAESTCNSVNFSVGQTDMSLAMRLPSVRPIDFEHHSQAPAMAMRVKMAADFMVGHKV